MITRSLTHLETAMAVQRATEMLERETPRRGIEHGQRSEIRLNLQRRMQEIHKTMFVDTHGADPLPDTAGHMSRDRATNLSDALEHMIVALYDRNGFQRPLDEEGKLHYREHGVEKVATPQQVFREFVYDVMHQPPFAYGNWLTLSTFMVELSRAPKLNQIFQQTGFDLRRVFPQLMHDIADADFTDNGYKEEHMVMLDKMLSQAMSPERDKSARVPATNVRDEGWEPFPRARKRIGGKRFLRVTEGDRTYLVTINGGRVPLEAVQEELKEHLQHTVTEKGHPGDFCVSEALIEGNVAEENKAISGEQFHRHDWPNATEIDGVPINGKSGSRQLPLVCLDVDVLTGLETKTQLPEVKEYLKERGHKLADLEQDDVYEKVKTGDEQFDIRLRRAHVRLKQTMPLVRRYVDEAFENRTPVKHPHFIMSMGGSGTGKSRLEGLAEQITDDNYVYDALDAKRYHSDIYALLVAAGHHSDDYEMIGEFATLIRDGIKARALKEHYNLYFDGSGVDYKGRYDKDVSTFKEAGFETHVLAANAAMIERPGREGEFSTLAQDRVKARLQSEDDPRAVPWHVVLEKHVGFPRSFFSAAKDPNVDHLVLYDAAVPKGQAYELAYTCSISKDDFDKMPRNYLVHNKKVQWMRETGLVTGEAPMGEEQLDCIPVLRENGDVRMLVVVHKGRFADMADKGLLDEYAGNTKGLMHNRHAIHHPDLDFPTDGDPGPNKSGWQLRLRQREDTERVPGRTT